MAGGLAASSRHLFPAVRHPDRRGRGHHRRQPRLPGRPAWWPTAPVPLRTSAAREVLSDRHPRQLLRSFHGPKTVFFGRWVIFLRVWAALFAGASRHALAPVRGLQRARRPRLGDHDGHAGLPVRRQRGAHQQGSSGILAWVFAICRGDRGGDLHRPHAVAAPRTAPQVEAAEERIHQERAEYEARRAARRAAQQRQ